MNNKDTYTSIQINGEWYLMNTHGSEKNPLLDFDPSLHTWLLLQEYQSRLMVFAVRKQVAEKPTTTGSDMFFNFKGKKFVHSEDITPDNFNELLDCITWDTSLAGSFDSYKPAYVVEVRNKFYREWDEEETSVSDVFMISHLSSTDQSWIKEYYPTFNERCERRGIKE